jgi:hypothetical protein
MEVTMSEQPTPGQLWYEAGEDPERYRELMREHGHILSPGDPGYEQGSRNLPCGWPGPVRDENYCRRCDVFIGAGGAGVIRPPDEHADDAVWLSSHCWSCGRSREEVRSET